MVMPWTFDALLPAEQRYTSLKFRRVARYIDPTRLDYADAAELCAFMRTIDGVRHARWIFHWGAARKYADQLAEHMNQFDDVHRMEAENRAVVTRADGLAVLKAMQDGGFQRGAVPGLVRMALLDMRDEGLSQFKIADMTGLTHDQVRVMANGPRRKGPRFQGLAGLWAS